eukprot:238819-Pyramimonas_sp.AAC.1
MVRALGSRAGHRRIGGRNFVEVRGNRVEVKGNRVEVKGNCVDVKGNRVDVKGKHVDVKGNRVDVKGKRGRGARTAAVGGGAAGIAMPIFMYLSVSCHSLRSQKRREAAPPPPS